MRTRLLILYVHLIALGMLMATLAPAPVCAGARQPMRLQSAPALQADVPTLTIADDFNDNVLNTTIWSAGSPAPAEKNGMLVMDAANSAEEYVYTNDSLLGDKRDITVSVDFQDFAVTGTGSTEGEMALELGGSQAGGIIALMKSAGQQAVYYECVDGTNANAGETTCTAAAGSFRIVYHHDTQVMDFLLGQNGAWTLLGTSAGLQIDLSAIANGTDQLQCYLIADASANSAVGCAFDNFYAEGGAYVPPQLGQTGLFERVTYPSGSDSRDFRMVVPKTYRPDRPLGILLGFHGNLGGTVENEPCLNYLQGWLEGTAEQGYYLTASLSVRKSGAGWNGTWNFNQTLSSNYDVKAVQDLVSFLKQYYAIDDDRIFASGHSNGGGFLMLLPILLPDFLAVSAPNCPVPIYNPPANAQHASCGVGGITDGYNTATACRSINSWHRTNGTDADCWIFDMGHSTPPDDSNVAPSRPWGETLCDYLVKHPRGYATRTIAPPSLAEPFRDDFTGSGTVPAAARWRVRMFDAAGVLYGPVRWDGTPGVGVAGYKFRTRGDALETTTTGAGLQGGICSTGFLEAPFTWKTAFKIKSSESSLVVWPLTMGWMSGKMLALGVTPGGWSWQLAPTHLAFRANLTASIQTLASGAATFQTGVAYEVQVENNGTTLNWQILEPGGAVVAGGTLASPSAEPTECAFGQRGTGAVVAFDYAEAARVNAARLAWAKYK